MSAVLVFVFALLGSSFAYNLQDFGCSGRPKIIYGFSQMKGDIFSPGYKEGQNYPDDIFCEYTIEAPPGSRIRIKFIDMDIEAFDLCNRDAIAIHEGRNFLTPVHGIFCGNSTYPDIISTGNALHIVFRSDFMVGKKGFHLQYSVSQGVFQNLCNFDEFLCRNRKCFKFYQHCDGKDDCGDGTDEEKCGHPLATTSCGLRPSYSFSDFGADRVIGGREANPGSWPWQADLQLSYFHPNGHMCGGTLLNAQWVVSAAHCFLGNQMPQEWRIHLGNHHKFHPDPDEQIRSVERIIVYPELTGNTLINFPFQLEHDIALIKLNAPVKFSDKVRPACLPDQGYELKTSTKCIASGWGTTRGTGKSHVLKEVDLWIETAKTCDGDVGPINDKTQICVSNREGQQDVCHGDSGGPLVCEYNRKWHVMGATSRGTATNMEGGLCAVTGSYTVYTKVSDKVDWINKMINKYS